MLPILAVIRNGPGGDLPQPLRSATTVAMIFGMLPLAMALGEGSEQRAPMGRAVIGGLITSTLLTLFVVRWCTRCWTTSPTACAAAAPSHAPRVVHAGPAVRDTEPVAAD